MNQEQHMYLGKLQLQMKEEQIRKRNGQLYYKDVADGDCVKRFLKSVQLSKEEK